MRNCTHCKYAEWKRTRRGTPHPSGDGVCKYPYTLPPLPASMFWLSFSRNIIGGGHINRNRELPTDCVYYERLSD
jgi:hypothetical protein